MPRPESDLLEAAEQKDLARHLSEGWVETYKKAMLTPVVLAVVEELHTAPAAQIAEHVMSRTRWRVTERGLYRTVRRMEEAGLLISEEIPVPRTGRPRKDLALTGLGREYLAAVRDQIVSL